MTLPNLTLALASTIMIGWLLVIGRSLLLPIILGVIVVYFLSAATQSLGRLPVIGRLPTLLIHLMLLLLFSLCVFVLGLVVAGTVDELIQAAPTYQANLEELASHVANTLPIDEMPNWENVRAATLAKIDIRATLLWIIGGLTSAGSGIFLVIVYAAFLFGEQAGFPSKLAAAFPRAGHAGALQQLIRQINRKIGDYLAVKTLINIVLGTISYIVMWFMDVDFALFWAVLIGLSNYIPYFGSLLGVMFPVVLSLAQFASISTTLMLAALLTIAQIFVGNFLEPRLIGKELNLSPFVVLVALAFWSAVWGLPGAILAVPMTSMVAIILNSFEQTRFAAILMAERPSSGER